MSNTYAYIVLDESGSMDHLAKQARRVAQEWVNAMAADAYVSVIYFSYSPRFVLHLSPPGALVSLAPLRPSGQTALRDAVIAACRDARLRLNADPGASVLLLAVTDGLENMSRASKAEGHVAVTGLTQTGRATVAALVPPGGKGKAEYFGMDPDQVAEWETTSEGLERASEQVKSSYQAYARTRSAGGASVARFFLDSGEVARASAAVLPTVGNVPVTAVRVFPVHARARIDEFATARTGNYVVGEWYYQLMKKETVQGHKQVLVETAPGVWHTGPAARRVLGLPSGDARVDAGSLAHGGVKVFVQSTSTNRNLIPGTVVVRYTP